MISKELSVVVPGVHMDRVKTAQGGFGQLKNNSFAIMGDIRRLAVVLQGGLAETDGSDG
jgi:hypothetical protein